VVWCYTPMFTTSERAQIATFYFFFFFEMTTSHSYFLIMFTILIIFTYKKNMVGEYNINKINDLIINHTHLIMDLITITNI
jgi:hypothetical protein